jgi:hypothetical protein
MSNTVTYFSRIEGGRFTSKIVQRTITELEGERVELTLRKRRSYRTNPQNRAFHGPVLGPITKALRANGVTGPDRLPIRAAHVKEVLKYMFLRYEVVTPDGEVLTFVQETSKLTKSEMADFITQCIEYAEKPPQQGGLGIKIRIGWEELDDHGFEVT